MEVSSLFPVSIKEHTFLSSEIDQEFQEDAKFYKPRWYAILDFSCLKNLFIEVWLPKGLHPCLYRHPPTRLDNPVHKTREKKKDANHRKRNGIFFFF